MTSKVNGSKPALINDRREIFGWAMYDWANSAFSTTVIAVFLGPYLASLAADAAAAAGTGTLNVLGWAVQPESVFVYSTSLSVGLQVFFLPILGAIADYSHLRKRMLQVFATIGAVATMALWFVQGDLWWLGALLYVITNLSFGAAMVFYNAFLPDIASNDQQDRVSSFGWAMGYLGGGLLLLANLILYQLRDSLGLSGTMAVRVNLASAGVWWFGFSFITWARLRSRSAVRALPAGETYLTIGFKQLAQTFREAGRFPHTLRFLLAYLIFNDGIQTVISAAASFAAAPIIRGGLGIEQGSLIQVILMIQFVAFLGALGFGRLAARFGARNILAISLVIWAGVVTYAYFGLNGDELVFGLMPRREFEFWLLGAAIALVMGGSQAISRSLFARMIPPGKEAEFFSIYEVSERGTSWIGPLLFGLVNDLFGNLRLAILSLILFFVVGFTLLTFWVNVERAIKESGRVAPAGA